MLSECRCARRSCSAASAPHGRNHVGMEPAGVERFLDRRRDPESPMSRRMPPVADATSSDPRQCAARARAAERASPTRGSSRGFAASIFVRERPVSSIRARPRFSSRKSAVAMREASSAASQRSTSGAEIAQETRECTVGGAPPGEYAQAVEQLHELTFSVAHEFLHLVEHCAGDPPGLPRRAATSGCRRHRSAAHLARDFPGQRLVLLAEPERRLHRARRPARMSASQRAIRRIDTRRRFRRAGIRRRCASMMSSCVDVSPGTDSVNSSTTDAPTLSMAPCS